MLKFYLLMLLSLWELETLAFQFIFSLGGIGGPIGTWVFV